MSPAVLETSSQGCLGGTTRATVCLPSDYDSARSDIIAKMREIVTASSAAGVAVAFGSPIGGVLFAIEVSRSVAQLSTRMLTALGDEPDFLG
jgi:hypothetical protein